mgnify:CR=1 FL=1
MKVEVLLATYNGERYIEEQLNSLLNQTYKDFTILIGEDCSTDSTLVILESYKKQYPNKIKILNNEIQRGHCYNFLNLLKETTGDYIFFCDQDDIWEKNKIELTLEKIKKIEVENFNIPILIHTDQVIIDEKGKILSDSSTVYFRKIIEFSSVEEIAFRGGLHGCTMLLNKKMLQLLKKIKIWECQKLVYHDWSIAIIAFMKGKVFYLDEKTMRYRIHQKNASIRKYNIMEKLNLKKLKENTHKIFSQYYSIKKIFEKQNNEEYKNLKYVERLEVNYQIGSWKFERNFLKKIIKLLVV